MIKMQEGRDRVRERLGRLEALTREVDRTVPLESFGLLCSGTDVRGPELAAEISGATLELLELLSNGVCDCEDSEPPIFNCSSPALVAGMLSRTFWLGYELGHTDE